MNKLFYKSRLLGMLAFLAVIAVFSAVAMLLGNALMPDIFAQPRFNYWQVAGLLILAHILFGGLGAGLFRPHGGYGRDGRLFHDRNQLREKWMNMTEEERKAFFEKEKDFMQFRGGFYRFHDFFGENARPKVARQKVVRPSGAPLCHQPDGLTQRGGFAYIAGRRYM
jgi:ABC-type multidrug transport system fused ATPase/permease subunit